jgi:hypothetical protein
MKISRKELKEIAMKKETGKNRRKRKDVYS